MNHPSRPDVIPEMLRPQEPTPKLTVETMTGSYPGFVDPKAIRIDANWGVWIDPKAEVVLMGGPQRVSDTQGKLKVEVEAKGFVVHMLTVFANGPHKFEKELHTSLNGAGLVPVAKVK